MATNIYDEPSEGDQTSRATHAPDYTNNTWIRAPKTGVDPRCGLTRSILYRLGEEGRIRTVALCSKGKDRGVRLFHLESILKLISSAEAGGNLGVA
jgi:hypothetical protein